MAFGSVSKQRVQVGVTRDLVLLGITQLGKHPVLVVEHLGESNVEFWNDAIAKANAEQNKAGKRKQGGAMSAAKIAQARQLNRETLIRHCVRDVRGFYHDNDKGVPDASKPASKADIAAIIHALPDDVIDDVLVWVLDANNFRDEEIVGDPAALAGE
jgi:hypothetical protein